MAAEETVEEIEHLREGVGEHGGGTNVRIPKALASGEMSYYTQVVGHSYYESEWYGRPYFALRATADGEEDNWRADYDKNAAKYGHLHSLENAYDMVRIETYLHRRNKLIGDVDKSNLYKSRIALFDEWCQKSMGALRMMRWYRENNLSHLARGWLETLTKNFWIEMENGLYHLFGEHHSYLLKDQTREYRSGYFRQQLAIPITTNVVACRKFYFRIEAMFGAFTNFNELKTRMDARQIWLETADRVFPEYNRVSEKNFFTAPSEESWGGLYSWFTGARFAWVKNIKADSLMNTPDPTVGTVAKASTAFVPKHPIYRWQSFDPGERRKSPPADTLEGVTEEGNQKDLTVVSKLNGKQLRRITYYVNDDGFSECIAVSPWSNPVTTATPE